VNSRALSLADEALLLDSRALEKEINPLSFSASQLLSFPASQLVGFRTYQLITFSG
jgi:hypothetical protein